MAYELYRCILNHAWRIEAISPTYNLRGFQNLGFECVNDVDEIQPHHLRCRMFHVDWAGTNQVEDISDGIVRVSDHIIQVTMYYLNDPDIVPNEMNRAMLRDQKDIVNHLELSSERNGYDDSNSSTDYGLMVRWVDRVDRIDAEDFLAIRISTINRLQES